MYASSLPWWHFLSALAGLTCLVGQRLPDAEVSVLTRMSVLVPVCNVFCIKVSYAYPTTVTSSRCPNACNLNTDGNAFHPPRSGPHQSECAFVVFRSRKKICLRIRSMSRYCQNGTMQMTNSAIISLTTDSSVT